LRRAEGVEEDRLLGRLPSVATVRQKPARGKRTKIDEEIIETGDIYFAYRPRVGESEAEGLDDVQRFFMVLKPQGGAPFRLAVLGRKRLPEAERHERVWGFIDKVAKSGSAIEAEFKEYHYDTKTRGRRTVPAARPAGEGVYALLQRGRNLHLTYELELPERPGEVQEELNIAPQGAYILSIKNPEKPAPPGAGLPAKEEAHYQIAATRVCRPALCDGGPASARLRGCRIHPDRSPHGSGTGL
jgi:hypothetical protein